MVQLVKRVAIAGAVSLYCIHNKSSVASNMPAAVAISNIHMSNIDVVVGVQLRPNRRQGALHKGVDMRQLRQSKHHYVHKTGAEKQQRSGVKVSMNERRSKGGLGQAMMCQMLTYGVGQSVIPNTQAAMPTNDQIRGRQSRGQKPRSVPRISQSKVNVQNQSVEMAKSAGLEFVDCVCPKKGFGFWQQSQRSCGPQKAEQCAGEQKQHIDKLQQHQKDIAQDIEKKAQSKTASTSEKARLKAELAQQHADTEQAQRLASEAIDITSTQIQARDPQIFGYYPDFATVAQELPVSVVKTFNEKGIEVEQGVKVEQNEDNSSNKEGIKVEQNQDNSHYSFTESAETIKLDKEATRQGLLHKIAQNDPKYGISQTQSDANLIQICENVDGQQETAKMAQKIESLEKTNLITPQRYDLACEGAKARQQARQDKQWTGGLPLIGDARAQFRATHEGARNHLETEGRKVFGIQDYVLPEAHPEDQNVQEAVAHQQINAVGRAMQPHAEGDCNFRVCYPNKDGHRQCFNTRQGQSGEVKQLLETEEFQQGENFMEKQATLALGDLFGKPQGPKKDCKRLLNELRGSLPYHYEKCKSGHDQSECVSVLEDKNNP